jgi:hypothetical protein
MKFKHMNGDYMILGLTWIDKNAQGPSNATVDLHVLLVLNRAARLFVNLVPVPVIITTWAGKRVALYPELLHGLDGCNGNHMNNINSYS